MLLEDGIKEIWCETQDDITAIKTNLDNPEMDAVEFIQVKHVNNDQLWSPYLLCQRKRSNKRNVIGTSLLERSLSNARCLESCSFRIVTSQAVNHDLRLLTYPLNSPSRNSTHDDYVSLQNQLMGYLPNIAEPSNGRGVPFWLSSTLWDVQASTSGIEASNLLQLEKVVLNMDICLAPDQRQTLYTLLLRQVQRAGLASWDPDPNAKKFKRNRLASWIQQAAQQAAHPGRGTLKRKMEQANISPTLILAAQNARLSFLRQRRQAEYLSLNDWERIDSEVSGTLLSLRAAIDSGSWSGSGTQFHQYCLDTIANLRNNGNQIISQAPLELIQGCMYERTDRCTHRFEGVPV